MCAGWEPGLSDLVLSDPFYPLFAPSVSKLKPREHLLPFVCPFTRKIGKRLSERSVFKMANHMKHATDADMKSTFKILSFNEAKNKTFLGEMLCKWGLS